MELQIFHLCLEALHYYSLAIILSLLFCLFSQFLFSSPLSHLLTPAIQPTLTLNQCSSHRPSSRETGYHHQNKLHVKSRIMSTFNCDICVSVDVLETHSENHISIISVSVWCIFGVISCDFFFFVKSCETTRQMEHFTSLICSSATFNIKYVWLNYSRDKSRTGQREQTSF